MFQFGVVSHNGVYEVEGVNTKCGYGRSIYVTTKKSLAVLLCRSLSHAHSSQILEVFKGWTGETDEKELVRLSNIINNGWLYYRPLSGNVMSESELYAVYKATDRKEHWGAWLNKQIKDGVIVKNVPLLECNEMKMRKVTKHYDKRPVSA